MTPDELSPDYPEEDIEWIIPAKAGYRDRKMAKWEGFILSEHAEMLHALNQQNQQPRLPKEKQSARTISSYLQKAFETRQPVAIQLDFIQDGEYTEDIVGVVSGVDGKWVHVHAADDITAVEFELIRHVSFVEVEKWYNRPPFAK